MYRKLSMHQLVCTNPKAHLFRGLAHRVHTVVSSRAFASFALAPSLPRSIPSSSGSMPVHQPMSDSCWVEIGVMGMCEIPFPSHKPVLFPNFMPNKRRSEQRTTV